MRNNLIIWNQPDRPNEILVVVELRKDLANLETEKAELQGEKKSLEEQKLELEREKFRSERFWKMLTAIGAVASAALGFAVTHFTMPDFGKRATEIEKVYAKSNDFLTSTGSDGFGQFLKAAQRESWFVGTSFYISVDGYRDELLARARAGVDFYFLVLDPESPGLSQTALATGLSEQSIKEQCVTGIRSLKSVVEGLRNSGSSGNVHVRLSMEALSSRLYFFDPRHADGAIYHVPYVNNVSSQAVPGYLFRNKNAPFHAVYFEGISKLWNSNRVTNLDAWLAKYPGF